jgi:hypothetical protein
MPPTKAKIPKSTGKKMLPRFISTSVNMAAITLETEHTVTAQWYTIRTSKRQVKNTQFITNITLLLESHLPTSSHVIHLCFQQYTTALRLLIFKPQTNSRHKKQQLTVMP